MIRALRQRLGLIEYQPPLGLQVSVDHVACLWVQRNHTASPTVLHAASTNLNRNVFQTKPGQIAVEDAESLAESIQSVLPPPPFPRRIALLVPDTAAMFFILEVEAWPRRPAQQNELIRWQLRQQLPYDIEHCRIRWQFLSRQNALHRVAVIAAWDPFLKDLEQLLKERNIDPGWTTLCGLALENLAFALDQPAETSIRRLIISWNRDSLTVSNFDGDNLLFKRSRTLTGDKDVDFETLKREIHLIMVYLTDYYSDRMPDRVELAGPLAGELADYFSAEYGLPAKPLITRIPGERWPQELPRDPVWLPLLAALTSNGGIR